MYIHKSRIYLHHTDAAGRLFFANQFYLIYEAMEHFLISLGLPVADMLAHPTLTFPLVHTEADYKAVLVTGDELEIHAEVEKIGETSVIFAYKIFKGTVLAGTVRTVSVVVNKATNEKAPIPLEWRKKFEAGITAV